VREIDTNPLYQYATGTTSAKRGWSIVGEEGPELMYMEGGEQVLPTSDTVGILSKSQTPAKVEVFLNGNLASLVDYVTVKVNGKVAAGVGGSIG
jgi:phage-related tail protein